MRAGLVINPTKVDDVADLTYPVAKHAAEHGWEPTLARTTADDAGLEQTRRLLREGSTS
jgi:hypothetical protein